MREQAEFLAKELITTLRSAHVGMLQTQLEAAREMGRRDRDKEIADLRAELARERTRAVQVDDMVFKLRIALDGYPPLEGR